MDKNAAQTLDPKLKEIYERVMSTQVKPTTTAVPPAQPAAPSAAPSPLSTQPQAAQPQPIAPPAMTPAAAAPIQPAPVAATPVTPQAMQPNVTFSNAAAGGKQETAGKKKSLSPILITVTGFVFFVIYTLFWLKFFSIPIPFLPQ